MKKLYVILIFIITQTLAFAQAENKNTITQDSFLTVLGSKRTLSVDFTIDEKQDDSSKTTVYLFSYKDKTVQQFSFILTKEDDRFGYKYLKEK